MKYTLHGFSQEKLMELGMDIEDAAILRYFIDFKDSGQMKHRIIDGETYYWLKYEGVLKELPILKLKKDSVYRRLKKMYKAGVLKHKTVKKGGSYSYYTVGERFIELISEKKSTRKVSDLNPSGKKEGGRAADKNPNVSDTKSNPSENNPKGVRIENRGDTDLNPQQNILLQDNPSTIKSINNTNSIGVYRAYEEWGFGLINTVVKDIIDDDIKTYGEEWVLEGMKEAVRQNKYRMGYVEGILRNWKRNGRTSNRIKEGKQKGGGDTGNSESDKKTGRSQESIRLEGLAEQRGLIGGEKIHDIECDF